MISPKIEVLLWKNLTRLRFGALLLLLCGGWLSLVGAHGQEACGRILASAEEKYRRSKHDEAIALVTPCLENGAFTLAEQQRAHTLLTRAYFAKKQNELAATSLQRLWQITPEWRPDPEKYPPPFCKFVEDVYEKTPAAPFQKEPRDSITVAPASLPHASEKPQSNPELASRPPRPKPAIIHPETVVLGLFQINLGAATHLGTYQERELPNPFLGHARLGFEYAELEFRRLEIVNKNALGQVELNTGAMKLQLPEGAVLAGLPALTGIFRISLAARHEDKLAKSAYRYSKSFKSFVLLLSKKFGRLQVQAGPSFSSLSLCQVNPNHSAAEKDSLCLAENSAFHAESKRNIFAPVLAVQAPIKSYVHATVALYPIPRYGHPSDVLGAVNPQEELSLRYSLNVGMHALVFRWLALDLGGIWRFGGNLKTDLRENEFRLTLGANVGVSLTEVFHELRKPGE